MLHYADSILIHGAVVALLLYCAAVQKLRAVWTDSCLMSEVQC
jgi:hypothetical protein